MIFFGYVKKTNLEKIDTLRAVFKVGIWNFILTYITQIPCLPSVIDTMVLSKLMNILAGLSHFMIQTHEFHRSIVTSICSWNEILYDQKNKVIFFTECKVHFSHSNDFSYFSRFGSCFQLGFKSFVWPKYRRFYMFNCHIYLNYFNLIKVKNILLITT